MAVLGNIGSVQVIVVFDTSFILVVYLDNELEKLMMINHLEEVILFQQSGCNKWHLHVPTHGLRECENIEIV